MVKSILPYDDFIDVVCEASNEAWHELDEKFGTQYTDKHHNELIPFVFDYIKSQIAEAEVSYIQYKEERDQELYYRSCNFKLGELFCGTGGLAYGAFEASYDGWRLQDVIDMYRQER